MLIQALSALLEGQARCWAMFVDEVYGSDEPLVEFGPHKVVLAAGGCSGRASIFAVGSSSAGRQ